MERAERQSRPFVNFSQVFPFPEDLLQNLLQVESKVLCMTLVSWVCQLLHVEETLPCCADCAVTSLRRWAKASQVLH